MPRITNTGKVHRGLPLLNRKHIEIRSGETKDFPDADFAAISGRKDVSHLVNAGILKVEGFTPPAEQAPEPKIELTGDIKPDGAVTAPKAPKAKKG